VRALWVSVLLWSWLLTGSGQAQPGTAQLVADIYPGPGDSYPRELAVYNGKLLFQAEDDGTTGRELWSFDGTTAMLEADIYPGGDSYPQYLTHYDGKLYFTADDGVVNYELWSFDGTTAKLEADIYPGSASSRPYGLNVYDGKLYLGTDYELWSFDGTTARP
jgi:ELWxxDGT repeat protein